MKYTGRFKEGQSGNPAGKPKGAADIRREYRKILDDAAPGLLKKCTEMADAGNESMMRLAIERIEPKKREETYLSIEGFARGSITDKAELLDQKLASDELSAEMHALMHQTLERKSNILAQEILAQQHQIMWAKFIQSGEVVADDDNKDN